MKSDCTKYCNRYSSHKYILKHQLYIETNTEERARERAREIPRTRAREIPRTRARESERERERARERDNVSTNPATASDCIKRIRFVFVKAGVHDDFRL